MAHYGATAGDRAPTLRELCNRLLLLLGALTLILYLLYASIMSHNHFFQHQYADRLLAQQGFLSKGHVMEQLSERCSPIHVVTYAVTYEHTIELVHTLKSILAYRSVPLYVHVLVARNAAFVVREVFMTWDIPQVQWKMYPVSRYADMVEWIPGVDDVEIPSVLRLCLPDILSHVDDAIFVEPGYVFSTDILRLSVELDVFPPSKLIGIAKGYGSVERMLNQDRSIIAQEYHAGVLLMPLRRMRENKWNDKWKHALRTFFTMNFRSLRDDQTFSLHVVEHTLMNIIIAGNENIVHVLPCRWNMQLTSYGDLKACLDKDFTYKGIFHFENGITNMPITHHQYFESVAIEHELSSADLLRRDILRCEPDIPDRDRGMSTAAEDYVALHESRISVQRHQYGGGADTCAEFRAAGRRRYLTHPFYISSGSASPYTSPHKSYDEIELPPGDIDISLVSQLSFDRIGMIEEICKQWSGPISLALYASASEARHLRHIIQDSDVMRNRENLSIHIVYRGPDYYFYPVNYLRNVAYQFATTKYIFIMDIDFIPNADLYDNGIALLTKLEESNMNQKVAVVVPAFETTKQYRLQFPTSKKMLVHRLHNTNNQFRVFHVQHFPNGHRPTNYDHWEQAERSYEVEWKPGYEPYTIVPRNIPPFDVRFVGFGANKASHALSLYLHNFRFIVLHDSYVIHSPHQLSHDSRMYRQDERYRSCIEMLNAEYLKQTDHTGAMAAVIEEFHAAKRKAPGNDGE